MALAGPFNVLQGTPFFVNSTPWNLCVTLTFQGSNVDNTNGVAITQNGTSVTNVHSGQTVTVIFNVPSGGTLSNLLTDTGATMGVTYEVENIDWGRG
jgi:archaellum component FlaF (FlaF/FlaG flagellin family)